MRGKAPDGDREDGNGQNQLDGYPANYQRPEFRRIAVVQIKAQPGAHDRPAPSWPRQAADDTGYLHASV